MAELADAQASGACARKGVRVQVPPRALHGEMQRWLPSMLRHVGGSSRMARKDAHSSTKGQVDDGLAAALAQFNKGVVATRQIDREQKALAKAERRRDAAAKKVKDLMQSDAGSEEKTVAEAEYADALAEWNRLSGTDADNDAKSEALNIEERSDTEAPADPASESSASNDIATEAVGEDETV